MINRCGVLIQSMLINNLPSNYIIESWRHSRFEGFSVLNYPYTYVYSTYRLSKTEITESFRLNLFMKMMEVIKFTQF